MKLHPAVRTVLRPASAAFGCAVRLRAWLYRRGIFRQLRLKGTVISVGNLTAGGTGKTPMVIWLAQRLAAEGKRAAVLTRGYRSVILPATEERQPPSGNQQDGTRISDELLVLRSHLGDAFPIGVGADRYEQGRRLEQEGVEWFVLDDGFQHLRLARDVEIVLVDATNPFDGGRLLPAGRLREPLPALARADIVVITRAQSGAAPAVEAAVRRYTAAPLFYAQPELAAVFRIHPGPAALAGESLRGKNVFAFCATGNPDAFFNDLRRWGMNIVGEWAFADHHLYEQRNIKDLERVARDEKAAALVCTEKDIPNFREVSFQALPVYVCRMTLEPSQPVEFWHAVRATADRKRL